MPAHSGPNTLGESNLVFAYDTGDVSNSYKGQPTVNTVGTLNSFNPLDLYTWAPNGNTSTWVRDTTSKSPVGGIPLRETSYGGDSYSGTYNGSGNNIAAASAGQTWTASVYALAPVGTNLQIWLFEANSSGNYVTLSVNTFTATGQWQRISVTRAFTDGTTSYAQVRVATSTTGVTILWDGLQVEQKAYPTPFVNSTRSATQGLLPLIGNSTLDLSNVSFDSNAQMVFDGTNDFIDTNFPATTLNTPTIEAVVYRSTATGRYEAIVQSNLASDDALYVYPGGTLGFWPCSVSSLPVPTGQWCYVAVSYNGTNLIYCVNGTIQTITATCTDITDWDFLRIGAHGVSDGERWIGKIAVSKVYDRALTAQEMQQNYQQYKTRFNLS